MKKRIKKLKKENYTSFDFCLFEFDVILE